MIISPERWVQIADKSASLNTRCVSDRELSELVDIITMAGKLVSRLDRFNGPAMASTRSAMECWSPKDADALKALEALNVEGTK